MNIFFIRHGEPDYSFINENMNCQWSNLAPLTKNGKEQALELRKFNELYNYKIISSPYTRAFQTATIFANGKDIILEPMLHEWLPSKNFEIKIKDIPMRSKLFKSHSYIGLLDFEVEIEMIERMNYIINKYKNEENLVVFSHSRLICTYLKSIGIEKKYLNYCEIVKVEI